MAQCFETKIRVIRLFLVFIIVILGSTILALSFVWYLKNIRLKSSIKLPKMDATLTRFNYTNNIIHYNLSLNIMVYHIVYHDHINASVLYQNVKFGSQTMETFNNSFSRLKMDLQGQHEMALSKSQIKEMHKEMKYGVYHFYVTLCSKPSNDTKKLNPVICCDLQISLKSNVKSPLPGGYTTQCDLCYDQDYQCTVD